MDDSRTNKRIAVWKLVGKRIRGRHREIWIENYFRSINVRGRKRLCVERTE